jgi:hypothetical protein
MRMLVILGVVLAANSAQAQRNDSENAADQFIQMLKAAQQQDTPGTPARQAQPVRQPVAPSGVTTIRSDLVTAAPFEVTPQQADQMPMNKVNAGDPPPPPSAASGDFTAPPEVKLKIRLTPKTPSFNGRAHLKYEYPNTVRISDTDNHAMFSKYNMPGGLRYSVKLKKDRKYLIEIEAAPEGSSGGHVQHHLGGETSTHEFGTFNEITNISRVVTPQETGWVNGLLVQGGGTSAAYWRVYAVEVTELD